MGRQLNEKEIENRRCNWWPGGGQSSLKEAKKESKREGCELLRGSRWQDVSGEEGRSRKASTAALHRCLSSLQLPWRHIEEVHPSHFTPWGCVFVCGLKSGCISVLLGLCMYDTLAHMCACGVPVPVLG